MMEWIGRSILAIETCCESVSSRHADISSAGRSNYAGQITRAEFSRAIAPLRVRMRRLLERRLLTAGETCRQQKRSLLAYLTEAIAALRSGLPAPKILL